MSNADDHLDAQEVAEERLWRQVDGVREAAERDGRVETDLEDLGDHEHEKHVDHPVGEADERVADEKRSEFLGHLPEVADDAVDSLERVADGVRTGVVEEMLDDRAEDAEDDGDREHVPETDRELRVEPDEHRCQHRSDEEGGPAKRLGAREPLGEAREGRRLLDDRERRTQTERFPRLRENQADEDPYPGPERDGTHGNAADSGSDEPEYESDSREEAEQRQRVPRTDSVRDRTAGVRVDGGDDVAERPEQADDEPRRTQRHHVLGEKSARHLKAEAEREHGHREDEHVAFEREKLAKRVEYVDGVVRG